MSKTKWIVLGTVIIAILAWVLFFFFTQRPGQFALVRGGMTVPRVGHTATDLSSTFGGNVLIAGGKTTLGNFLSSAELFDTQTERFVPTGSMRYQRTSHRAVPYYFANTNHAHVFIFGGGGAQPSGPENSLVERYDPAAGVFADAGNLLTPRAHSFGVVVIAARQFLVVGGVRDNWFNTPPLSDAEVFDFAAASSQSVGPMTQERISAEVIQPIRPPRTLTKPLATGFVAAGDLYDYASQTFTATTTPALAARREHTMTLLRDGRVLIVGGARPSGQNLLGACIAEAEIFDPATDSFIQVGSLVQTRFAHTATLLNDGRVLVVGGRDCAWGSPVGLQSAELFDPVTGTFTRTGSLISPRWGHTATRTNTGKVLVTGGRHLNTIYSSAELYRVP